MAITLDGTNGINSSGVIVAPDGSAAAPAITNDGDTNTGIFFPAADTIAFAEGGVEAMRIDSSGNVGIGTTNPDLAKFQIGPATGFTTGNATTRLLTLGRAGQTDFVIRDTTSSTEARYRVDDGVVSTGAVTNHPLVFVTNATERARIDTSGNLLVGTTSTGGKIRALQTLDGNYAGVFDHNNTSPFGVQVYYSNATPPNNTTNRFLDCEDTGGFRFQVRSNGGIANYSANNVNLSDRREKTNFAPAKNYLDTICCIPVQTFNYVDQNLEDDPGLTLGVVAQDVQEVAPELVMESNWAGRDEEPRMRLSVYQTDLQYALMKSIQELKAINDAQASRIETLEAKVAALEAR
jgi:hypothetical protein